MIRSIEFKNFRVLRDARLELRPFNLIVGANGSGKSTVFRALRKLRDQDALDPRMRSFNAKATDHVALWIEITDPGGEFAARTTWSQVNSWAASLVAVEANGNPLTFGPVHTERLAAYWEFMRAIRFFSFEPDKIANAVPLAPNAELAANGSNLAAAMDALRDADPDAFSDLREELHRWLPSFDAILFETPADNQRAFKLRTTIGRHSVPAKDLSEGIIVALALLTLAYSPQPPAVICLEEPDRGLHPRLLRDVRDALYRLAYPERFGLERAPVQVIATTHSPYFLDLFKDSPEEVTIAERDASGSATFKNLAAEPQLQEVLGGATLGDAWFSGVLGGVPLAS